MDIVLLLVIQFLMKYSVNVFMLPNEMLSTYDCEQLG